MRCEAAEFNDVEWNVRETEKIGDWNGKSVKTIGTDQAIQQVYVESRVDYAVRVRPIIGDYTPDENSVGSHLDNSSSSSSDRQEAQREADEHFANAKKSVLEALVHSANAGLLLEACPPVAVLEGYQAVEAWKDSAREYNAGCEAEKKAQE